MAAAGDGNVSRAQIAANLGQDSRAISVPRERLIDKGVIEPVGHGLVRFTLPGFAAVRPAAHRRWVRGSPPATPSPVPARG